MTAPAPSSSADPPAAKEAAAPRLRSVDVLRAVTMAVMVFVNHVGGAVGAPAWTQHLAPDVDGYTVTDLVLPWFLFLVGVSLPLSIGKYLRDDRRLVALRRVIPRAAGLILLGLIFIAPERLDPAATGLPGDGWFAIGLVAAFIVLKVRTPSPRWRLLENALKVVSALLLVLLFALYRSRTDNGTLTWLQPEWWGIPGYIGWAYLVAALDFLLVRGNPFALLGLAGLHIAIAIGIAHGRLGHFNSIEPYLFVHDFVGTIAALVVIGAIAGVWLVENRPHTCRRLALFGVGLWTAGWFLRPLHGYHKDSATESWVLVAAGQAALALALCHLFLDRPVSTPVAMPDASLPPKPKSIWLRPADALALVGRNALLAYLLSEWIRPGTAALGIHLFGSRGRPAGPTIALALATMVAVLTTAGIAARHRFMVKA